MGTVPLRAALCLPSKHKVEDKSQSNHEGTNHDTNNQRGLPAFVNLFLSRKLRAELRLVIFDHTTRTLLVSTLVTPRAPVLRYADARNVKRELLGLKDTLKVVALNGARKLIVYLTQGER